MRATMIILGLVVCLAGSELVALASSTTVDTSCKLEEISGTFTTGIANYFVVGTCLIGTDRLSWTARVVYQDHRFQEDLNVQQGSQLLVVYRSTHYEPCEDDPWLTLIPCRAIHRNTFHPPGPNGSSLVLKLWVDTQFFPRTEQSNRPFSSTFAHDRAPLLAKRDADLKAEARRLKNSLKKVPLIAPLILAPTANALFLSNTSVPIKIAPPQGMTVTSYMVRLENRTAQGAWIPVTNLPIAAAEASSPSGYLGWGTPGNGRSLQMIASPGTYRISAQVVSPRTTGWSNWVEFVVTTPNKAIKKAPKMFGQ